jgi:hypothetical protein
MAEKKYIGKPGKQDDPCWKGYEMVGMKKKGGRQVPNCVPEATDIIAKAKAAVAKKAGAKLKMDPDTGTPDHFTAAQRRKKGLDEVDSKRYPREGFPQEGDYGYHPNPGLKPQESDKDEDMDKAYKKATEKEGRKPLNAKITEALTRVTSGNKGYGYHGTVEARDDAEKDKRYSAMHRYAKKLVGDAGHLSDAKKPNVMVKHFLDSPHGRHIADSPTDKNITSRFSEFKKSYKPEMHEEVEEIAEKRGLWDNIHAKRKRIKSGSGERMRKPGSEGAPSAADLKASQTEAVAPYQAARPRTTPPQSRNAGKTNDALDNSFAKRNQDAIDKRNASIKRSAEAHRRMLHPDTAERKREKPSGYSTNAAGYSTSDRYKSVKEELGKSNEWGTDALRKKYAAMTPGQESMAADKIPSFDPRYDNVTTQYCGGIREGYLAEISARGAEARAKFQTKVRQTLADPANIKRAKKTLAKRKEAEKAKEPAHLVMQLRKAVSIGSKVHFQDGSHHAITGNHADIFMSKYNSAKSSIEKEALQKRAHKSHSEFMRTIAEDHSPDCEPMDNIGTHHVDSYEAHRGSGEQISPVISHDDEDIRFQDFDETAFEKELEADVLALSWDDLVDLYDEDEIEYDESPEEEGEDLEEGITPAGRLKKKFNAMRSKSRRMMARNIAIKRVSSPEKLKSRSIRAARRMVYKRLLRNRDISTVSSSEKTRLEAQIKRMAPMVARLSVRVMPAVRKLEQSRIKNSRMRKRK